MNARFADLTLTEAAQRLRRYRPLLVTVALTLTALRLAPGGVEAGDAEIATPASAAAPGPAVDTAGEVSDQGAATPPTTGHPAPMPRTATTTAPVRTGAAPTRAAAPVGPTGPPLVPSPVVSDGGGRADAATVGQTAWATLSAGTPLAAAGVPDGALPVGNRLGRLDKASFLALEGAWSVLALDEDPEGTSSGLGDVALRACVITTADWTPGGEKRFDEAPEWSEDCVEGTLSDGTWTFPVGDLAHEHGVALLPGPDAPVDFQVALVEPRAEPSA